VDDRMNRDNSASLPNSENPMPDSKPTSSGRDTPHPIRRGLLLFCPHRMADSVLEIDVEQLKAKGIEGVILDLDNTLVRWAREELTEEILAWIDSLRKADIKFCLLSNSVLSRRVERVAAIFRCPNIRKARKPRADGFHRAMKTMNTTPATTAVIGDQMFTDILGGNRVGIYTIMVKPMSKGEFVYTRYVSRPPERFLLRLFQKRGHL
jgi:HAD superfamily phosphatase (TIGR01668 family)